MLKTFESFKAFQLYLNIQEYWDVDGGLLYDLVLDDLNDSSLIWMKFFLKSDERSYLIYEISNGTIKYTDKQASTYNDLKKLYHDVTKEDMKSHVDIFNTMVRKNDTIYVNYVTLGKTKLKNPKTSLYYNIPLPRQNRGIISGEKSNEKFTPMIALKIKTYPNIAPTEKETYDMYINKREPRYTKRLDDIISSHKIPYSVYSFSVGIEETMITLVHD